MTLRNAAVAVASVAGLYTSQHMYRKALRARRGELRESSVVETPNGNLFFGQPNSLPGLAFYAALLASTPIADVASVRTARRVAATLAALSSAYLGYSLLFKTKMPCPYCWTSHGLNAFILVTLATAP